jgi:hypothetical protein
MKVEDMLVGKNNKRDYKCLDTLGNELRDGDLVTILFVRPPMFRIVATQAGGLATPNGVQPQAIRVVCDMNIIAAPGQRLQAVVKVVSPLSEALLDKMGIELAEPPTKPQ